MQCIRAAIRDHEKKTQTRVVFDHSRMPSQCPRYVKICLFRFVQEGLTNSFRHAQAQGQRVFAEEVENGIQVVVSDTGPEISEATHAEHGSHLGLFELRSRIESIGGALTIRSETGLGTTLTAYLPTDGRMANDRWH